MHFMTAVCIPWGHPSRQPRPLSHRLHWHRDYCLYSTESSIYSHNCWATRLPIVTTAVFHPDCTSWRPSVPSGHPSYRTHDCWTIQTAHRDYSLFYEAIHPTPATVEPSRLYIVITACIPLGHPATLKHSLPLTLLFWVVILDPVPTARHTYWLSGASHQTTVE